MICPFIRVPTVDGFEDFECTAEERLEDPNDNFGCEDCCHYQSVQKANSHMSGNLIDINYEDR